MLVNHSPAIPDKHREYGTREEALVKISQWLNSKEGKDIAARMGKDFALDVAKCIVRSSELGEHD